METKVTNWWCNQSVVFHSLMDIKGMEIGKTYTIKFLIGTEHGLGFILKEQSDSRVFLAHLFIPKLDYLDLEQNVYELFYNN